MTAVNKYEDDGGLDFKAVIANLIHESDTAFRGKVFRFLSAYSYGVQISDGDCVTHCPDFTVGIASAMNREQTGKVLVLLFTQAAHVNRLTVISCLSP